MIGRKAIVGLSLLSALLFCALAAQSVSAAPAVTQQCSHASKTRPLKISKTAIVTRA